MIILRYSTYFLQLFTKGSPFHLAMEITKDILGIKNPAYNNKKHIDAAINWIMNAINKDNGVSAFYSLYNGWQESYSETTGYIISTIFNYYHETKHQKYREAAINMADWELTKQLKQGAFPGGAYRGREFPIVFNTGQVIFGMVRAYQETNDQKYKKAAIKAADWLLKVQDKDGCWRKSTYRKTIHTYNTRVAWSLLRVHSITKNNKYREAAIKNIEWALTRQTEAGWFENNAFHPDQEPLLHTIAYSIRGILECGIYLKNQKFIDAAKKPAEQLIRKLRSNGSFAGTFNRNWNSSTK